MFITGKAGDPQAATLENAANSFNRFAAVLRVTPERMAAGTALAPALAETLPHLRADVAQALVCVGMTCRPPVSDPAALVALLKEVPAVLRGLIESDAVRVAQTSVCVVLIWIWAKRKIKFKSTQTEVCATRTRYQ